MPRSSRALLFDLDDTIYPSRRFRLSGFAAVARHVARFHGVNARAAFRVLTTATRRGQKGHELDALIQAFNLKVPATELVRVIRGHQPLLRLPRSSEATLRRLRRSWRIGVVTNGIPVIQGAKVNALGLGRLVDTVVYASDYGSGEGKPDRAPFLEALRRLQVAPSHAIAVGDDVFADVFGAASCGLRTIQTREWRPNTTSPLSICADLIVDSIVDVPEAVEYLLPRKLIHYAA